MDPKPPDVIVLGALWPERALLRAQLIEEGHEVVAVDTCPIPRLYRRPGMKPRVLLIDLHELPRPRETLDEVRFVLPPERVVVVTALGSHPPQLSDDPSAIAIAGDELRFDPAAHLVIERRTSLGLTLHRPAAGGSQVLLIVVSGERDLLCRCSLSPPGLRSELHI